MADERPRARPVSAPRGERDADRQAAFRTGISAESRAAAFLIAKGFRILARRWRRPVGEIDIVARRRNVLVFIEVKARGGRSFGEAAEAVTWQKRRRLTQLALRYLTRERLLDAPCRFDVVSIHLEAGQPVVTVFQNAFDAA